MRKNMRSYVFRLINYHNLNRETTMRKKLRKTLKQTLKTLETVVFCFPISLTNKKIQIIQYIAINNQITLSTLLCT